MYMLGTLSGLIPIKKNMTSNRWKLLPSIPCSDVLVTSNRLRNISCPVPSFVKSVRNLSVEFAHRENSTQ